MRSLINWDNKTWLSSNDYINNFHKFLKSKVKIHKNLKILDIGCGRANIISFLQRKYKFKKKAIGIDIVKNRNIKKNIIFKKIDAINYLKIDQKFDLILIKQTIHFFSERKLKILLNLIKKNLNKNGTLLIFSLKTEKNKIPAFKLMKLKLKKSLKRDKKLLKTIKRNLINYKSYYLNFKVDISREKYVQMIENRYISCLLEISKEQLQHGINEIKIKYKPRIKFIDTLLCILFNKKVAAKTRA